MSLIGRILCALGYHRFRFYEFGSVGIGTCERCGNVDR